ncbi:MAG: methionyl-tRNA formyltransferase [Patescibacteria group bacterium]
MKIAFFGTPPFTASFLDILSEHGYTPSLIVTNPDRPAGRGMTLQSPEPKIWGEAHEVSVLQPEKIDADFLDTLSKDSWDLFIVIAYGKILPEALIRMPKYGTINLHYSLLPKYRGATPVESAILNGDSITGISTQQMRFKLDSGPVLMQQELGIDPNDTTPSLREKLNAQALIMFPTVLEKIFNETVSPQEQSEDGASHCKKISKEDGELHLEDDPIVNDRKYRAYYGSVGTYFYTYKNGERIRVKITKAHLDGGLFVIDEVIPENGKRMDYRTFLSSIASL